MPQILVVDDEPDYRFLLRMLLRDHGVDVVEASNGRQALEHMATALPDLVVTDVTMPHMGGAELILRIREDERTRDLPVLIWSADPDRDLPADSVVAKPYGGDRLVNEIIRLVER